jgi:Putative sensor
MSPVLERARVNPVTEELGTEEEAGFFSIVVKKQTYKNILYIVVSFPLGAIYFATIAAGAGGGFALIFHGLRWDVRWTLVFWLPLLILYFGISIALTWVMIALERRLASRLLGANMPRTFQLPAGRNAKARWALDRTLDPTLYKGIVYLVAKFPLGVVSMLALVISTGLTVACIVSPFHHGSSMQVGFGPIYIGATFRILLVLLGLLIATMALHLMGVIAGVARWFAQRMIDRHPDDSNTQETVPIGPQWANETRTWDT